jgi:hypothetical protein
MSDPIRTYLDSVTNLDRVTATAKMQIAIVAQVAQALQRDPLHFMFSNTNIGMPGNAMGGPTADGSKWPTAEQIQAALSQWHHARLTASQAWNSVPQADRNNLKPPPT